MISLYCQRIIKMLNKQSLSGILTQALDRPPFKKFSHFDEDINYGLKMNKNVTTQEFKFISCKLVSESLTEYLNCATLNKIGRDEAKRGYDRSLKITDVFDEEKKSSNDSHTSLSEFNYYYTAVMCAGIFDWERDKIHIEELLSVKEKDLEFAYELKQYTMTCINCGLPIIFESSGMGTDCYCQCRVPKTLKDVGQHHDPEINLWKPVIAMNNVTVWSKPHPKLKGLTMYKMYGCYNDIDPEAFYQVHYNVEARVQWDTNSRVIKIMDQDKTSNSDLIYWTVKGPGGITDRDYVYKRRVLYQDNEYVICNRAVNNAKVPINKKNIQVNIYHSDLHIRPKPDADTGRGVEFTFTYYHDFKNYFTIDAFANYAVRESIKAIYLEALKVTNEM